MFLPAFRIMRKAIHAQYVWGFDSAFFQEPFFIDQLGDSVEIIRVSYPRNGMIKLVKTMRQLRHYKADIVLMPYVGRSWKRGILMLSLGADRVAYFQTGKWWLDALLNPSVPVVQEEHRIETNLRLVRSLSLDLGIAGIPSRWVRLDDEIRGSMLSLKTKPWIGIHVGANKEYNAARQWPLDFFRVIVERVIRDWGFKPILFGKGQDEADIRYVISGFAEETKVVLNRPLREVACYIDACDMFLGNDSGLMNLSVGVGTPTIGILGPTDERHTGPYGSIHQTVKLNLPCRPCHDAGYSAKCPRRKCLLDLSPDLVWTSMSEMKNNIGLT